MTPEQQRIAIAEACGYKWDVVSECWRRYGEYFFLPDYLNDLNAMHEAEKYALPFRRDFHARLVEVVARENPGIASFGEAEFYAVSATAAHRAEAFLKTLGLWTE